LRNERLGKESLEKGSLENERMEREREWRLKWQNKSAVCKRKERIAPDL